MAEMREAIIDGRYPPGALLRQETIAKDFGVSRVPVRQVLLQLEAEGLVKTEPRRGARVTEVNGAEIEDVFELRLLIEPRLLALSVPAMDDGDIIALRDLNAAYADAIAREERSLYGQLNTQFHLALYKRSNRPKSLEILYSLLQASNRYTRVVLATGEDLSVARDEHAELIDLCRAGLVDRSVAALKDHLGRIRDGIGSSPQIA